MRKTISVMQRQDEFTKLTTLAECEARHWYLLASVSVLGTVGLAFALAPALSQMIVPVWPWANTYVVLLSGLIVLTSILVGYLSVQQSRLRTLRSEIHRVMVETSKRSRQNASRLHALLSVSRIMGSVTNFESVFESITDTSLEVFDCQQASLMLLNKENGLLEVRAATGHQNENDVAGVTVRVGEGIAGWVAEQQKPLVLNKDTNLSQYPDLKLRNGEISAAMVVPIVVRDELVGVLNISSRSPSTHYTNEDLQALSVFAENAGTCIRHTQHVEWMRKTIQSLQAEQRKRGAEKPAEHSASL